MINEAFEKNWRDRRVMHRTPGGKLTRVKISSLPAKEQQKYNPTRFKNDSWRTPQENQPRIDMLLHSLDFYVDSKYVDLSHVEEGTDHILATTDIDLVDNMFGGDYIKIRNVPARAVTEYVDSEQIVEIDDIDFTEIEFLSTEEFQDDIEELYNIVKFSDIGVFKLDLYTYRDIIEVVDGDMDDVDDEFTESVGFYEFYKKQII